MINNDQSFCLLDTTLRDGSYAVNFQFSSADVEIICNRLEKAGIRYIEVGHGMGLGASNAQNGLALQSDQEYLEAAQKVLNKASFGAFCIPGIAELSDLELAKSFGMGFVRIGTNINQVQESKAYIEKAKKMGMLVMANYMKSYAASPKEFAENVKKSETYGADVVYIVDSAGGMFPEDINKYFEAIRSVSDIKIGFHAHNNLGLGVSNSLFACELGIDYIDCSLQGLGRSAGNASTELLVSCLKKKNIKTMVNEKEIMLYGKQLVSPLLKNKGINPLDVICGVAEFHTSYMKYIHRVSAKYQVNPLDLIVAYSKIDKINMNEERLEDVARQLPKDLTSLGYFNFSDYIGNEQDH